MSNPRPRSRHRRAAAAVAVLVGVAARRAVLGLAIAAAGAGAAQGAANLFVEAKTDYLPGVDFIGVNVEVCERDRPTVCAREGHPANARQTAAYAAGVRVAEVDVLVGRVHKVTGTLVNAAGKIVARRQLLFDLRRAGAVAALLFARPEIEATKTGTLAEDRDGDGGLSHGDVLRYEVVVRGADRFTDAPGPGGKLVAGSVTTTHGTVTDGNDPGDTAVAVKGLAGAGEEGATIEFEVEVEGVVSNQGVALKDQAAGTANWSTVAQPTDNPATPTPRDPTIFKVGCSLDACEAERAQCEIERQLCEQELVTVRNQLEALTADPDGDGVQAVLDLCPGTPQGTPVDDRGCSRPQYCARIDVSTPAGQTACTHADWRDDEPGILQPGDCLVLQSTCGAT